MKFNVTPTIIDLPIFFESTIKGKLDEVKFFLYISQLKRNIERGKMSNRRRSAKIPRLDGDMFDTDSDSDQELDNLVPGYPFYLNEELDLQGVGQIIDDVLQQEVQDDEAQREPVHESSGTDESNDPETINSEALDQDVHGHNLQSHGDDDVDPHVERRNVIHNQSDDDEHDVQGHDLQLRDDDDDDHVDTQVGRRNVLQNGSHEPANDEDDALSDVSDEFIEDDTYHEAMEDDVEFDAEPEVLEDDTFHDAIEDDLSEVIEDPLVQSDEEPSEPEVIEDDDVAVNDHDQHPHFADIPSDDGVNQNIEEEPEDPEDFDPDSDSEEDIEFEEDDDYNEILTFLSKEWLEAEMNHRVSKTASNKMWNIARTWFHRMYRAKEAQNIRRKTPSFAHIRKKMHEDYVPNINMTIAYKHKETGEITMVEDSVTPVSRFPPNLYSKIYEIAEVKVNRSPTSTTLVSCQSTLFLFLLSAVPLDINNEKKSKYCYE